MTFTKAIRIQPPPCTCCDERPGCDGACTRRPDRVGASPGRMRTTVPIGIPNATIGVLVRDTSSVVHAVQRIDTGIEVSLVAAAFVRRHGIPTAACRRTFIVADVPVEVTESADLAVVAASGCMPTRARCLVVANPLDVVSRLHTDGAATPASAGLDVVLGMDCIESAQCSLRSNVV
jgi:hypothetical protein